MGHARVVLREHASRIFTELQAEEAAWRAANRSARCSHERIGRSSEQRPPGVVTKFLVAPAGTAALPVFSLRVDTDRTVIHA